MVYISERNDIRHYLYDVSDDDEFDFNRPLSSMELRDHFRKLIDFKENLAQRSDLARFCLSFLEIIEILLNLIYATSSGNCHWYVESLRSTLPWFFAYDRTNYSRYLIIHYTEKLTLENIHPDVYNNFHKGKVSVQTHKRTRFYAWKQIS